MKTVYIMRHAKAERDGGPGGDHDRKLNPTGREAASHVGSYFREHGIAPDTALVSSAARTQETWERVAAAANWEIAADVRSNLYLASASAWMNALTGLSASCSSVLLVGHNPGVESLAAFLAGSGDESVLAQLRGGFPTGAFAILEFEGGWGGIRENAGRAISHVRPKDLSG